MSADGIDRPYKCQIQIKFPHVEDATRALQVLEVDEEIGNRVVKNLSLLGEQKDTLFV